MSQTNRGKAGKRVDVRGPGFVRFGAALNAAVFRFVGCDEGVVHDPESCLEGLGTPWPHKRVRANLAQRAVEGPRGEISRECFSPFNPTTEPSRASR